MSRTLPPFAARPVPRYTSYPTAPHFGRDVTAETTRAWLGDLRDGESLSIYIHVPYCRRMCWYCGCHTKVTQRYAPVGRYVEALIAEIALLGATIKGSPVISQVHWGGGTPTILSAADFAAIMHRLRARFPFADDLEIAVEIDPRTLAPDMVEAMAEAGVTRASLGVQDCNHHVQVAINRVQPFEKVADAVCRLRRAGILGINFDLMYGLPMQDRADVERTVDRAVSLKPDRLAAFGYAHVPWMKTHQRMIDASALPDAAARFDQAEAIAERLRRHGYDQIGIDHFALPSDSLSVALRSGRIRRNFQGYTADRAESLIGLGASSISAMRAGYAQNSPDLGGYVRAVKAGRLATARGIALDADDRRRRAIIERLMCYMRVDIDAVCREVDDGESADFDEELARLRAFADDGLVRLDGRRICATAKGRPWIRLVCAVFDRYLEVGRARHSAAI